MCGIVGIFSNTPLSPEQHDQCSTAINTLKHRGPDNCEKKKFLHAAMGHTRLSIVDLSSNANQPFSDQTRRWCISWNGEIYNYQELRKELENLGQSFSTQSDTEVVLTAYKTWGYECLNHFNGMWAIAIFDRKEQSLFLSRDRYGIKPLYWAEMGSALIFASEFKAFFPFGVSREPNWNHLSRYLIEKYVDESEASTVFKNIYSIPPGHNLSVSLSGIKKISSWWSARDHIVDDIPEKFEERVSIFRNLFEDAIRLRARNDVPTGVTLSGGIDSSSVYGAYCKLHHQGKIRCASDQNTDKKLTACSVIFPGNQINEYPWIEPSLKYWKNENNFLHVTPSADIIPELIAEMVWYQEAPVWSPAIFSLHSLYKNIASAGIRVVLEGHGADEMLGGYPSLIKASVGNFLCNGEIIDTLNSLYCLIKTTGNIPQRFLKRASRGYRFIRNQLKQNVSNRKTGQPGPAGYQLFVPWEIMRSWTPPENFSAYRKNSFNDALDASFSKHVLPYFLRVFDRATMAYSVESCPPFLDHRLVNFAFSLPPQDKVSRLSKKILREAARDWLPDGVINRRVKVPFNAPFVNWFNAQIVKEYLYDTFNSNDALSSCCINGPGISSFLNSKKNDFTEEEIRIIWPVLNLYLWERRFCRPHA